jgi:8-oxo-dGTP diphosphatase
MTSYVVGFAFSPNLHEVMLVEKKRPKWQIGLLNGPGGRIEVGESPLDAMVREFREETGLGTHDDEWTRYASLEVDGNFVHFFYHVFVGCMPHPITTTDETVVLAPLGMQSKWLPNLRWLIPMALNHITKVDPTEFLDIVALPRKLGA